MLRLLRYLRGYVLFSVSGLFPERFINLASRKGIRLWNTSRSDGTVNAAMYMSDYLRIRETASAAGVRLRIIKKAGLPVFARRCKDRQGVMLGAFVFIATVFVMSQFIWSINITGLQTVSESDLRSALKTHGLYIGAFKPALDFQEVSRKVMLDNGAIGWMAVNVSGSYADVEIKEESPKPKVEDISEPCNVKAARDGTIISIDAGEGDILIKEGSGVTAGQLIVSGVMDDQTGVARLVRANAVIKAATTYHAEFSLPPDYDVTVPTGERGERKILDILGLRIPLSGYSASSGSLCINSSMECPAPLDTALPIGMITERAAEMSKKHIKADNDSSEEILTKLSQLYEVFTLSECRVTSRKTSFNPNDDKTLTVTYSCIEDIARQEAIGTDENTDLKRSAPEKKDE